MQDIQVFEGQLSHVGGRYLIVVSRFNAFVVEPMLAGAIDTLKRSGVDANDIIIVRVPGAYELPIACRRGAEKLKPDAVIALGAVIRGSTAHFDFVAGESCKGIASVGLEIDCPIAFGVITTDTIEQAIERAGSKAGNKGSEAAHTALEMVSLFQAIDEI